MEKEKNYDYAHLSKEELEQIHSFEKAISKEKGEEVVLVAYKGE